MLSALKQLAEVLGFRQVVPSSVRPLLQILSAKPATGWLSGRREAAEVELSRKDFKKEHPFGLRRDELAFNLDAAARVDTQPGMLLELIRYLSDHCGFNCRETRICLEKADPVGLRKWLEKHGPRLRLWQLFQGRKIEDVAYLQWLAAGQETLYSDVCKHPLLRYVLKLELSMWHWREENDKSKVAWSEICRFHRLFMNFDLGLPGFDVNIDYCMPNGEGRGWGEFTGNYKENKGWLDSELAFIITYRGKQVMTVGVSPSPSGLLVSQIQLWEKKGNRWLYKLPMPYFEYVLLRLHEACRREELELFVPTGESVRKYVLQISSKVEAETLDRIEQTYNQPLKVLVRSPLLTPFKYLKCQRIGSSASDFAHEQLLEVEPA